MKTSHRAKGAQAEAAVVARLTDLGLVCSTPEYHSPPYDVIVDHRDGLPPSKVQIKRGYFSNGKFRVELRGKGTHAGKKAYTEEEVDAFAIYNNRDDEVYWFWYNEAPQTGMKRYVENYRDNLVENRILSLEDEVPDERATKVDPCVECGDMTENRVDGTPYCSGSCLLH